MGAGVLTRPFPRVDGQLRCGDVPAGELAERFDTPLYVYDLGEIRSRVGRFRSAFADADPLIAYSVKANGNLTLLRELKAMGCGADVTSLGELFRARRAGIPSERIVFAGVGKTRKEIEAALEAGIYGLNVESAGELRRIEEVARSHGVAAPFAVRINPDVRAETPHEYTATGQAEAKFGVASGWARELYRWGAASEHLAPRGVDVHIGSQIVDPNPYLRAVDTVLELVGELDRDGIGLEYFDVGGGFGISYDGGPGLDVEGLAEGITARMAGTGLRLIVEPGRAIVGEAGVLLTRVLYVKESGSKTFVIVDGAMSDLIRPSHYGGYHEVERVDDRDDQPEHTIDLVGPICETGDFLARGRRMELPRPGELVAVRTVGAYGFTMASNYNGRRRPAEVIVDGSEVTLARRRETLEDLVRAEESL